MKVPTTSAEQHAPYTPLGRWRREVDEDEEVKQGEKENEMRKRKMMKEKVKKKGDEEEEQVGYQKFGQDIPDILSLKSFSSIFSLRQDFTGLNE